MNASLFLLVLLACTYRIDGRSLIKKRSAYRYRTTTTSTQTTTPLQCEFEGKFYKPGEYIYQQTCSSIRCSETGEIVFDGVTCPEGCAALAAMQPHACCRPCEGWGTTEPTTVPQTDSPLPPEDTTTPCDTTKPPGCDYLGEFYEIGDYIYKSACSFTQCTQVGIVVSDYYCPSGCNDIVNRPPNECCPPCETTTLEIATPSTSAKPGCWDNGKFYEVGEYVYYHNACSNAQCLEGGIVELDPYCPYGCADGIYEPVTECCPACEYITEETTTEIPTTTPPFGCWENGRFYEDGEYLYKEPCYSAQCVEGHIRYGDIFCPSDCYKLSQMPPNDCCKLCENTTTTEETTTEIPTTTPPFGCWDNGRFYEDGEYLYKHPCYSAQCCKGQITYGDIVCPRDCYALSQMPPNDCCKLCETTTTTEEKTTVIPTTTPSPPFGCWDNGRFYQDGEYLHKYPCYFAKCEKGHILYGDIFCPSDCNKLSQMQPNDCCKPCQNTTTSTTTTASSSNSGGASTGSSKQTMSAYSSTSKDKKGTSTHRWNKRKHEDKKKHPYDSEDDDEDDDDDDED